MKLNIAKSAPLLFLVLLLNGCGDQAAENVQTQSANTTVKEHVFQGQVEALNKAKQVESMLQESAANRAQMME